jgi:hypothetical protein
MRWVSGKPWRSRSGGPSPLRRRKIVVSPTSATVLVKPSNIYGLVPRAAVKEHHRGIADDAVERCPGPTQRDEHGKGPRALSLAALLSNIVEIMSFAQSGR